MAELCLGFMIALLRKIREQERSLREGGTKLSGNLLKGKTVGIVGCGRIGRMTARLCKAFGCRLLANDFLEVTDPVFDKQVDLETLLSESDIVSLHCPLTPDTQGLIDGKALRAMKKTAFLINTARGRWWTKRRWHWRLKKAK